MLTKFAALGLIPASRLITGTGSPRRYAAGCRLKSLKAGVIRRFRAVDEEMYPFLGYELRGSRVYRVQRDGSEEWLPGLSPQIVLERAALGNLREVPSWEE